MHSLKEYIEPLRNNLPDKLIEKNKSQSKTYSISQWRVLKKYELNKCKAEFTVLTTWGRKQVWWRHAVEGAGMFSSEYPCIVWNFYAKHAFMN